MQRRSRAARRGHRLRYHLPRGSVRTLLILGLFFWAVAVTYGQLSPGTYQDDDVDRYFMSRQVWEKPTQLLDRWGMPLVLLLFAIPSRWFGFAGIEVTTGLITAGGAVATGLAARALGLSFPWLAALFFFLQPMVFELSFSALGEPVAALLIALVLWAWYAGRPGKAVVIAGLLPLARIDAAALTAIVFALAWSRVGWRERLGAVAPVLIWNLAGLAYTGEWLYVLSVGGGRPLFSLGVMHYIRNSIVFFGPVVLFFVVWAVGARVRPGRTGDSEDPGHVRFPALAAVLAVVHVVVLTLLAWETIPFGRSVGFLRHLVSSSPAWALVAVWGFQDWVGGRGSRLVRVAFAVGWTLVVVFFLSHVLVGHSFIRPGREEWRWMVTASLAVAGIAWLWWVPSRRLWTALAVVLTAGTVTFLTVPPIELDLERQAVQKVVEYLQDARMENAIVYTNHPWFAFLSGRDRFDHRLTPLLTREAVRSAPTGSLVLWDNHYGDRLWGDVPIEELLANPQFRRLFDAVAGDTVTFRVALFQRVP